MHADHRLRVQQQEYSEVQQISNHLGTVGHGQRVQQYGTAVVNGRHYDEV